MRLIEGTQEKREEYPNSAPEIKSRETTKFRVHRHDHFLEDGGQLPIRGKNPL